MEKQSDGYSYKFWGLVTLTSAGLCGGLYYLYNYFSEEDQFSEETNLQIEEMKQEAEENQGELTTELAIKIMALTNKTAEEMIKKTKPDIDERRRNAINNPEEYERICGELLEAKEYAYQTATGMVLKQFGIQMEDLQNIMQKINPVEMEKRAFEVDKPTFDGPLPEKAKVKEMFIYYGNKLSQEMKDFHRNMSMNPNNVDPQQQEIFIFRILVLKLKIDDELFFKYKHSENQIRYLLYEYGLLDDPEIKQVTEKIARFEDYVGMGA